MLRNGIKHATPITLPRQRIEVSLADARRFGCGRTLVRAVCELGTLERLVQPSYYRIDGGKRPEPTYQRVRYGTIRFQGAKGRVLALSPGRWELYEVKSLKSETQ